MLEASMERNDKKARALIWIFSFVVFAAVVLFGEVKIPHGDLGFDVHIFAKADAWINTGVTLLLLLGLWAVKTKNYILHKKLMMSALVLSILFLVCYVAHRLLSGEALYGDSDHDGVLSDTEKAAVGGIRYVYYLILGTHILLAAFILPFILFTTYRALTAQWSEHKKRARYTWPLWLYVSVTGPVVYWMIVPYYR
ncbi:MAG: DUF420 domain-containing protein [Chitinophagaceae bacterium]